MSFTAAKSNELQRNVQAANRIAYASTVGLKNQPASKLDSQGNASTTSTSTSSSDPSSKPVGPSPKVTGASSSSGVIKYSTSSDPRSTAYSLTSPAPNAADFSTAITHAGQVPAGTVIGYNAEKNITTYYGGDLVINPSSLIVSAQFSSTSQPFTVSMPDGSTASMPTVPWNEQGGVAFPATSTPQGMGSSWTMFMQLMSKPAPSDTPHIIHLVTTRSAGNSEWEYDAFIPLIID